MQLDSINAEQRLYIVRSGDGISCIGFDVAARDIAKLATWLGDEALAARDVARGTPEHWQAYRAVWDSVRGDPRRVCEAFLSPQLIGLERRRVEVSDVITGEPRRFLVGKSTGWAPVHLELCNRRSRGGAPARDSYARVRVVD